MEKVVVENNLLVSSVELLGSSSKKFARLIKQSESQPVAVVSLYYNQALSTLISDSATEALQILQKGLIYITCRINDATSPSPPQKKAKLSNSDTNTNFSKLLNLINATKLEWMQMLLTRYALFYGYLLLVNTLRGTLPKDFQSKKPSSILRSIIRMGKASSVNVRRFAEDYGGFLLALERLLIKQKPQEALQTLQTQVEQTVTQKSGFIANVCISHATAHENLQWYTVFLLGELHYFVKNYQEAKNLFQECIQHNFQATVSYCMGALSMIGLGGYQQALEHLEKAIQMEDGLNMFAVVNVILLYRKLNQPAFELGILKYIMQGQNQSSVTSVIPGRSLELRTQQSENKRSASISDSLLVYWLARAALQKNDYVSASEAFTKLLSTSLPVDLLNQTNVLRLLHEASYCFLQTKEYVKCNQTCDKILDWNSSDIIALVYKSDALLHTDQPAAAIDCLLTAHKLLENSTSADSPKYNFTALKLHVVNNLAVSLICVDQFDESFKIIQTALESESGKREIREEEIPQLCLLTVNGGHANQACAAWLEHQAIPLDKPRTYYEMLYRNKYSINARTVPQTVESIAKNSLSKEQKDLLTRNCILFWSKNNPELNAQSARVLRVFKTIKNPIDFTFAQRVVLVKIDGPDSAGIRSKNKPFYFTDCGQTSISASGIYLGDGLVATVGTLIYPFLNQQKSDLLSGTSLSLMFDSPSSTWESVELVGFYQCDALKTVVTRLTGGSWKVGWLLEEGAVSLGSQYKSSAELAKYQFLSSLVTPTDKIENSGVDTIVFLRIENQSIIPKDLENRTTQINPLHRGQAIYVVGSPWGILSRMNINSISRGIISNITTEPDTVQPLAIIDARVTPGVEGGGVFGIDGTLMGMCLAPLRKTDDAVVLNFMIPIQYILSMIPRTIPCSFSRNLVPASLSASDRAKIQVINQSQQALVVIKHMTTWTTGIIISQNGYIVTNAHLFGKTPPNPYPEVLVRLHTSNHSNQKWHKAQTLFVSPTCIDIALIQLKPLPNPRSQFSTFQLSNVPIQVGQPVMAIGYPIWNPSTSHLGPTATEGIISKLVDINGIVEMIQTDAAVHKGNSGGALVDLNGNLIGLVTFIAKPTESKYAFPRNNYSIPIQYIQLLLEFSQTLDESLLNPVIHPNSTISALWSMSYGAPLPKDPPTGTKLNQFLEKNADKIKSRL